MPPFFQVRHKNFDYGLQQTCRTCQHTFRGRFCNICGEKVTDPNEKSLSVFLGSLINAFTFLDNKFVRSVKLLMLHPGTLSKEIANGIQVPYMKPVSLFFVANFFYFLFPFFDSFNSSLYSQMNLMGVHSEVVRERVKHETEARSISLEDFQKLYQSQSTNLSKLFLIVLVIVMAVFLAIVNFSKKHYFFDHLLLSLEFYSFHLVLNMLLLPFTMGLLIRVASWFGLDWNVMLEDQNFSVLVFGFILYFLLRAQRQFYAQKWYWALPRAILLLYLFTESVQWYRKSLFYLTVWTI